MAVYSKLLLSSGGGIVSTQQQAKQTQGTATVLIGLGGTGVHCIRTIKTQVYSRLKPDDENAVVPEYSHIRFLGVDTTAKSRGGALVENQTEETNKKSTIKALDDTEFFSISNRRLADAFKNKLALKQRTELSWLDHENIPVPNLGDAGAGGIRQIGRFMMMDKSQQFMTKLSHEISEAKSGLGDCRVNIHIFAGLSGGTGSGCFLDVCYMVRSVAERIGGVNIYGYFFLPDVNLANVALDNVNTRQFIPKNGYAAMQELDYCMGLPLNGGSFAQEYQGNKTIHWAAPPVDMCHLICATDEDQSVIPNAYDYAMNVTAEYVMDFLTDSDEEFGISEHLSNFRSMVGEADEKKLIGSEMAYCVIGASCASIPLREINTYLASELFAKFSRIGNNIPTKTDVEALAIASLARDALSMTDIYNSLYRELCDGFDTSYEPFPGDWKEVMDYGNGPTSNFVRNYTNQTAAKLNIAEKNAKSMVSENNLRSLIGRVDEQLKALARDINYGPVFAHGLISAAKSHNLLNIIDGLIQENTSRWDQEAAQKNLRHEDYERAREDFERRKNRKGVWFDSDQKRFGDYEFYLLTLTQHELAMECYQKMNDVLVIFRKQLETAASSYYIKLKRVFETLIETFKENRDALADEKVIQATGSFAVPLMSIGELKKSLDDEIENTNIPGMLTSFMGMLLENTEAWIHDDENKISKLVNDFFVDVAFEGFANRTITSFLKDKYRHKYGDLITDAQLTEFIYNDWMKMLTSKAKPLFCFNRSIWSESMTGRLAFLSYPSISMPIKKAAEKMQGDNDRWKPKESALTDRIFVMCSACGLPLSAYNNCTEYEQDFFSAQTPGRHYYNEWYDLPSITPQSHIETNTCPHDLSVQVERAKQLHQKASDLKVLDDQSYIYEPNASACDKLSAACDACEQLIVKAGSMQDVPGLENARDTVQQLMDIPMTRTNDSLPRSGSRKNQEVIFSIQRDHFVSSPALHAKVADIVARVEATNVKATDVLNRLEEKITEIKKNIGSSKEYIDAVLAGVITVDGILVTYPQYSFGIKTGETALCMYGEEYPYSDIPVYQGYLSYQTRLDDKARAEIKNSIGERFNSMDPKVRAEIKANGIKLKGELSEERMQAWIRAAMNTVDPKQAIDFVTQFNEAFQRFCPRYGI